MSFVIRKKYLCFLALTTLYFAMAFSARAEVQVHVVATDPLPETSLGRGENFLLMAFIVVRIIVDNLWPFWVFMFGAISLAIIGVLHFVPRLVHARQE